MIRFFGIGRSRIQRGSVLRVFALLEHRGIDQSRESLAVLAPELSLIAPLELLAPITESPGVKIEAFGAELDTGTWKEGEYVLNLRSGEKIAAELGERLWVLERDTYELLLDEETRASETPGTTLTNTGADGLTRDELAEIVQRSLAEKLTGFLCVDGKLLRFPQSIISFEGRTAQFLPDPLGYITDVFADQCRDLLLFGAKTVSLNVTFTDQSCRLSMSAKFERQLSDGMIRQHRWGYDDDLSNVLKRVNRLLSHAEILSQIYVPEDGSLASLVVEAKASTTHHFVASS